MKKQILIILLMALVAVIGCTKETEGESDNGTPNVDYNLLSSYYELGDFAWGESEETLKKKQTAKLIDRGTTKEYTYISYETGKLGGVVYYFFEKNKLCEVSLEELKNEYADKLFDLMKKEYGNARPLDKRKYEFINNGSRIFHEVFGYDILSIWLHPEVRAIDVYYNEPLKSWVATKSDIKAFEKRKLLSEGSDNIKYLGSKQETEMGYFLNKSGTIERGYVMLPGSLNAKVLEALTSDYGKPAYDKVTKDYLYTWQRDVLFKVNGLDVYYSEYEDHGRHILIYYSWQDRWTID